MPTSNPIPGLRRGAMARKVGYIQAEQVPPPYKSLRYTKGTLVSVIGVEESGEAPSRPAHLLRPHARVKLENGLVVTAALEQTYGEILAAHGTPANIQGKKVLLMYRGGGRKAMEGGKVLLAATESGDIPQNEDIVSTPYSIGIQNGISGGDVKWKLNAHKTSEAKGETRG